MQICQAVPDTAMGSPAFDRRLGNINNSVRSPADRGREVVSRPCGSFSLRADGELIDLALPRPHEIRQAAVNLGAG
jgi:hypothetical protein